MEGDARVGGKGNVEMAPLQQQVQVQTVGGGTALVLTPTMDSNLPQPLYMLGSGQVMTDEQLETLRRQISVYSTICQQLVEMHKASVSAQSSLAGQGLFSPSQMSLVDDYCGRMLHNFQEAYSNVEVFF